MLFLIVTNILLPVAILGLLAWVWSRWNLRRTPHTAPSQEGLSFREEPARIKQMWMKRYSPKGSRCRSMNTDPHRLGAPLTDAQLDAFQQGRWTICVAVGLTLVLTLFTQVGSLI